MLYLGVAIFILTSIAMLRELLTMARAEYDWFIIFLTWHDKHGNRQFEDIDALYGTYEGALKYAHERYELQSGECFAAELCLSPRNIKKAKQLAMRSKQMAETEWTAKEFESFMSQPAYQGDYCRYMRN